MYLPLCALAYSIDRPRGLSRTIVRNIPHEGDMVRIDRQRPGRRGQKTESSFAKAIRPLGIGWVRPICMLELLYIGPGFMHQELL